MRVLVVDDSAAFRTQIRKVLDGLDRVEVVGTASNGRIAVQMLEQKPVDLVTLDLNMPVMGGLEVLEQIRAKNIDCKVIVFAAKSARSAKETIQALALGAVDFLVKPSGDTFSLSNAMEQVDRELVPKIRQFVIRQHGQQDSPEVKQVVNAPHAAGPSFSFTGSESAKDYAKINLETFKPLGVVIASSTGGPSALEDLFSHLKGVTPRVPIFLAQHMPETFTKYLAKRIQDMTGVVCREAVNGEHIEKGMIYVAPGNFHMKLNYSEESGNCIVLDQGPKVHSVRPAADHLFDTAVELYGPMLMGFVLTGMGEDGALGASHVKDAGGAVMIQDQESSTVWGMPGATHELNAFDRMADIHECGRMLKKMCE